MVPLARLERALRLRKRILNPSRLPVPPQGHGRKWGDHSDGGAPVNQFERSVEKNCICPHKRISDQQQDIKHAQATL